MFDTPTRMFLKWWWISLSVKETLLEAIRILKQTQDSWHHNWVGYCFFLNSLITRLIWKFFVLYVFIHPCGSVHFNLDLGQFPLPPPQKKDTVVYVWLPGYVFLILLIFLFALTRSSVINWRFIIANGKIYFSGWRDFDIVFGVWEKAFTCWETCTVWLKYTLRLKCVSIGEFFVVETKGRSLRLYF